ncbi:MAG: N-acetylglutaminylglutamine synthetase [Magnetovibrionaceae bacterium]
METIGIHTEMASLRNWGDPSQEIEAFDNMRRNISVDCGWGRLFFGQTFESAEALVEALRDEKPGQRDVALYLREPHVALSLAPQEMFLDPSHTFRLPFDGTEDLKDPPAGLTIREMSSRSDADAVNRIYIARGMVPAHEGFLPDGRDHDVVTVLVAEDNRTGSVIGTVYGVDHKAAFDDPDNGSSLWALAVDPQCPLPGVGRALVQALAGFFRKRGRAFLDLSVMHNNEQAIELYAKMGFRQVPVYCMKNKNSINEKLYVGPSPDSKFNPYARLIIDEARRRGIGVEPLDPEKGYFSLSLGGRTITCRESLTDLTTAVAMSRCDDKAVTRRLLEQGGLRVPAQVRVSGQDDVAGFLSANPRVVVKPARGEQGQGISVDLTEVAEIKEAIEGAKAYCSDVLLEEFVAGEDLRIIVIDYKVVAAAIRRPAQIVGDGEHSVQELIEKQSRRRAAATRGESSIPLDDETHRHIRNAGYAMDSILEEGVVLPVRKTANLHTGGTIHDVTDRVHRRILDAAVKAAQLINIPVVGLDFLVPSVMKPEYVIIEANERPGLANHEPQPTAERFMDLLFPQTRFGPPQGA